MFFLFYLFGQGVPNETKVRSTLKAYPVILIPETETHPAASQHCYGGGIHFTGVTPGCHSLWTNKSEIMIPKIPQFRC